MIERILMVVWLQILSRKSHVDDETYNMLMEKTQDQGYDVSKLHKTQHSDTPPGDDESLQDTKGIWWLKSLFGK